MTAMFPVQLYIGQWMIPVENYIALSKVCDVYYPTVPCVTGIESKHIGLHVSFFVKVCT